MNGCLGKMRSTLLWTVILGFACCMGCASPGSARRPNSMALDEDLTSVDTSKESVAVFTLRIANQLKPGHQMKAQRVVFIGQDKEPIHYKLEDPYREVDGQYKEQLVSVSIPAGKYELEDVYAAGRIGILSAWHFEHPVNATVDVAPNSIVYLGHLTLTNREKKEGERATGMAIPLVDQALAGMSTGALDIIVTDQEKEDISAFIQAYPCLKNRQIQKSIMRLCGNSPAPGE